MGVYTDIERTLGLTVTHKLEKIRDKFEQEEGLSKEELIYLLNQSARYETIQKRLRDDKYKVSSQLSMEEYEIQELLGNIVTELNNIHLTKVDGMRNYRVSLGHIHILGGQRMSMADVRQEVKSGVVQVRLLQRNFDENGDNYKVIGTYDNIKKDYGVTITITSEDKEEDVLKLVQSKIKECLEKERDEINQSLAQL